MSASHQPPKYWRSLGELADTPEFRAQLEAEFPVEDTGAGFSRRRMLQLMGASLVLASAGSCRWKEREVLPFNKRPENRTPGKFERYATAMELGGTVLGLLVTCVDGRPIKVEGNPKHPNSLGATNAYAQAAILELYDPDRSRNIIEKTPQGDVVRSWEEFLAFAKPELANLRDHRGEGLAVISESSNSPTLIALRDRFFNEFPQSLWCTYEPIDRVPLFPRKPLVGLGEAEVVLCVEDDVFGTGPNAVRHTHDFMKNRDLGGGKMKRLYVIESTYSVTGAMADHRLALPLNVILRIVNVLFRSQVTLDLFERRLQAAHAEVESDIEAVIKEILGCHQLLSSRWAKDVGVGVFLRGLIRDLVDNPRTVAVFVGQQLRARGGEEVLLPGEVKVCVREPNLVLDEFNFASKEASERTRSDTYYHPNADIRVSWGSSLENLCDSLNRKEIKFLWILGGNPVLNAPADFDFSKFLPNVPNRIHLGNYFDETSRECSWHVPRAHFLEAWGDTLAQDGTYSVMQPMIEPLHGGKSMMDLLMLALDVDPAKVVDEIRSVCKQWIGEADFDKRWRELLHDGCVAVGMNFEKEKKDPEVQIDEDALNRFPAVAGTTESGFENGKLEITFRPSPAVYDGRFANLSWLQEMPDPITRITWDNVALFSPATAEKLGVKHEEVVRLKFKGREIEIPAYILPGQADGSVAVTLGYGRTAAGKVGGSVRDGIAPVGVNTYKLRTSDAMWFGTGLTVEPTGRMHPLASVAEHFAINSDRVGEDGRKERLGELVREATLAEYRENPTFAKSEGVEAGQSLWQEHQYEGHCWGMTVDLSKCVGCGACVVACMAENNVPVVGKERIFRNREMHWLRVDRYFRGDPANPQIVFQPMFCQHCEMAPCEGVCPVGATVHSSEGLNEMVYNRCVGTRYCANNCPYKVRRFNFFNYHKQYEDPDNEVLKMASNPQVTVRMRGVMEKCTYCVQRIQAVKIEAKNEKRAIRDGEIRTACQQVCPAGAIVFGDLNDETSEVYRLWKENRSYPVLGELYTKPRTWYLARIRNPNPELEKSMK